MQASETKLRQLIEGTKQYVIPLFQRPYSWSEKQWKTLWSDISEQSKHNDGRPHFFGSIVSTAAKSIPQGVGKWLLIDGQQRITTVQIFLAAIRDMAAGLGESQLSKKIDAGYLTNSFEEGNERLKVLPTQDDRVAFQAIMRKSEISQIPESKLKACYSYFLSRLESKSPEELDTLHLGIVDKMSLVSITCDEHDNPHLIFESLNAKGEKLTPADLIRNFLLMRVHVGEQERLFKLYWLPIQQTLKSELTEFVRHYLMKEGKILKAADVYFELKERLVNASPADAEALLKDLHIHGLMYASFLDPTLERDSEVSERLDGLRRLKFTVAYPLLLRLFDSANAKSISREQLIQALDLIESFLLRRSVCNKPSNQLQRMLSPSFDSAGGASPKLIHGLQYQLGGKNCPDDNEFFKALTQEPLYSTTVKNARLRLILERIERSFAHKEPADLTGSQIEHVMPQTLTTEWKTDIGDNAIEEWSQLLHTLGNLTLTKYNADMSNKQFEVKKKAFATSHYVLNNYFAQLHTWSSVEIRQRSEYLATIAIRLWPDVGRHRKSEEDNTHTIALPVQVRFRTINLDVTSWKDAFIKLLQLFDESQPGLLHKIATDGIYDAFISLDKSRFARSVAQINNVFVNKHASAKQLQNWCKKIAVYGKILNTDYQFIIKIDK